jgi:hypothetical protein
VYDYKISNKLFKCFNSYGVLTDNLGKLILCECRILYPCNVTDNIIVRMRFNNRREDETS